MLPLTWEVPGGSSALLDSYRLVSRPEGTTYINVPDMSAIIPVLASMVAPKMG